MLNISNNDIVMLIKSNIMLVLSYIDETGDSMKHNIENYTRLFYSAAVFLIMAGFLLIILRENYSHIGISLINIGAIMIFATFIKVKRLRRGAIKDERTVKIGAYGLSYSWLLSLVLLSMLFWVDYMQLVQMTVTQVLGIMIFAMVFSAKGFQWYLFRKGDVE